MSAVSVVNRSSIAAAEVEAVLAAVNKQVSDHFEPAWGIRAWCSLIENDIAVPGDSVIYVTDEADVPGALGRHDLYSSGMPCGFVFTRLSDQVGDGWSVTFSHEVLELIADPEINLLCKGPHPRQRFRKVNHWREMSDAVQARTYEIDGVKVSDFVLPAYFTEQNEPHKPTSYMEFAGLAPRIESFGIAPGGYVGFEDPLTGQTTTVMADAESARRAALKQPFERGRRAWRRLAR